MVGVQTDLSLSAVQLETPLLQGCLVSIQLDLEALQALHSPLPGGHSSSALLQATHTVSYRPLLVKQGRLSVLERFLHNGRTGGVVGDAKLKCSNNMTVALEVCS